MQRAQQTFLAISAGIFLSASAAHSLTFSEWQAAHFTTAELADPAISGPNADPDGDGRANLIEYAFGLDPLVADQDASTSAIGPNGLTLTYPEVVGATDLLYHLEQSPDILHWVTPNSPTRSVLSDDGTKRLGELTESPQSSRAWG